MKILLTGYIGKKNFGDDLLFKIAVDRFKNLTDIDLSVAIIESEVDPNYLKQYYEHLNILKFSKKLPIFLHKDFDLVFYIGGGVFFDYREELNFFAFFKKYISTVFRFNIPKVLGTKYGGIGIGIGPYYSKRAKKIHTKILSNFNYLGVRDFKSLEEAKLMNQPNVVKTNDLSIGAEIKRNANFLSKEVIICPRSYKHKVAYEKHFEELLKFSKVLIDDGFIPHWVFLQEDKEEMYKKIKKNDQKLTIWNPDNQAISDFMFLFGNAYAVISSRMHSIYIAGLMRTPFIGIEVHQKVKFASELFIKEPILIDPLSEIDSYKDSFQKIEAFTFDNKKLRQEVEILREVEKELLEVLIN